MVRYTRKICVQNVSDHFGMLCLRVLNVKTILRVVIWLNWRLLDWKSTSEFTPDQYILILFKLYKPSSRSDMDGEKNWVSSLQKHFISLLHFLQLILCGSASQLVMVLVVILKPPTELSNSSYNFFNFFICNDANMETDFKTWEKTVNMSMITYRLDSFGMIDD